MLNVIRDSLINLRLLVFLLLVTFTTSLIGQGDSDGEFFDVASLADSLLNSNEDSLAKIAVDKLGGLVDVNDQIQFSYYHKLLGDFYLGTSRYAKAVDAYEPLLPMLKAEFNKDFSLKLARAINDLGIAYMKVGSFDDAIEAHIQSQVIYDRYNEPQGGSYNYNNIAIIYTKLKKIDSALIYHQKSLEYAKLAGDTLGIGFNYMNMGILYLDNNDPLKALYHFQESLKVFEETGNERMVNAVNRRMGTFYGRINDYESALFKFSEVLAYFQKEKSDAGLGGVHVSLAEVLLELGRTDSAYYHIKKSIEYYEPTGYKNGISKAYHILGWYYKEKKMYSRSLDSYQYSLDLSEGRLLGMTMSTLNGMSEIYMKQNRFQDAVDATLRGLEVANYSASPGNMAEAYYNLSSAYKAIGNSEKALDYLEKHNLEKEKIFDDEQMFQMARTEYKNQLEREEAQRELEQQQRDLLVEQEIARERWMKYGALTFAILILFIAFFAYRGYVIKKAANSELAEKNERLKELRENEKRLSEETISSKERELATMAMASHEKNSVLNDLNQKISFLESRMDDDLKPSLKEMQKTISNSYSLDNSWDSFLHKFENVHPQFFDKLKDENPVLTAEDLKLSAYLKIGMSNKEIANVTHITLGSVKSKINRLKKKLEMGPDESLRDYMLKYA